MQIEQALYGESRGGHSLLASSGDDAVSTAIVQRLDLPDTAPPDAEWSPFLRGFPYQDRYVLSRTFHDTAASRGGMVFSHALLAPLDEMVETPDLQPLLRLLATSNGQRPDATTVRLPCTDTPVPRAIDLIDAADALAATGTFLEAGVEERLARATPRTLDQATAASLEPLALSRGWLRLHGTVLSASASASDAARRQVAVDTDPSFLEGLRAALRRAKPAELVECALEIEDPRMPRLTGEAVAKDPKLLAGLDLTPTTAQAIWREALAIEPESWQGPTDPAAAFHSILDRLLDGSQTDPMLLERLSDTPLADLVTYPRRPEIWSRIGDGAPTRC